MEGKQPQSEKVVVYSCDGGNLVCGCGVLAEALLHRGQDPIKDVLIAGNEVSTSSVESRMFSGGHSNSPESIAAGVESRMFSGGHSNSPESIAANDRGVLCDSTLQGEYFHGKVTTSQSFGRCSKITGDSCGRITDIPHGPTLSSLATATEFTPLQAESLPLLLTMKGMDGEARATVVGKAVDGLKPDPKKTGIFVGPKPDLMKMYDSAENRQECAFWIARVLINRHMGCRMPMLDPDIVKLANDAPYIWTLRKALKGIACSFKLDGNSHSLWGMVHVALALPWEFGEERCTKGERKYAGLVQGMMETTKALFKKTCGGKPFTLGNAKWELNPRTDDQWTLLESKGDPSFQENGQREEILGAPPPLRGEWDAFGQHAETFPGNEEDITRSLSQLMGCYVGDFVFDNIFAKDSRKDAMLKIAEVGSKWETFATPLRAALKGTVPIFTRLLGELPDDIAPPEARRLLVFGELAARWVPTFRYPPYSEARLRELALRRPPRAEERLRTI